VYGPEGVVMEQNTPSTGVVFEFFRNRRHPQCSVYRRENGLPSNYRFFVYQVDKDIHSPEYFFESTARSDFVRHCCAYKAFRLFGCCCYRDRCECEWNIQPACEYCKNDN
jgi:hypothetical protein